MSTPPLDSAAVQALVAEVIRRITTASPRSTPLPAAITPPIVAAAARDLTIADRVITLAHLERLPAGVGTVVVQAQAVITPSARDRTKRRESHSCAVPPPRRSHRLSVRS